MGGGGSRDPWGLTSSLISSGSTNGHRKGEIWLAPAHVLLSPKDREDVKRLYRILKMSRFDTATLRPLYRRR